MTELERKLALKLLDSISKEFSDNAKQELSISRKRSIHLQPGFSWDMDAGQVLYTRERFLNVLNALKEKGVLMSWYDDYKWREGTRQNLQLTSYNIYF